VTRSGGVYDDRGPNCLKVLRDIIRFAMGQTADASGKKISELVYPLIPLANNVGLVGWSNGGNATITVAGLHGREIAGLAWIVNWESPVGDGMQNVECGANPRSGELNPLVNPDRAYVESVLGSSAAAAPDNDALQPFDHLSIRTALEPAGPGGVPTNAGVQLGRLAL
jgi:hypothetical protein